MKVQPAEIGFDFLVVGVVRDRGLEPGGKSSEFFPPARRTDNGCAEWGFFRLGERRGNEI